MIDDRRVGLWSAVSVVVLGAAYLLTGAAGLASSGYVWGEALEPTEPFLTICRALMLLLLGVMVVLFAALKARAGADAKALSLAAMVFVGILAGVSGVNNLVLVGILPGAELQRHSALVAAGEGLFPAVLLPLELFAWGPVFGSALLCAATGFGGDKLQAAIRAGLVAGGILCMGNVLCFVTGDMRFSMLGIVGYDVVFPVVCVLLAVFFRRALQ